MGKLTDRMIRQRMSLPAGHPLRLEIDPFVEYTKVPGRPSHGLGSMGYDLRLGRRFKYVDPVLLAQMADPAIDPMNMAAMESAGVIRTLEAEVFTILPGGFVLAESMERVRIPRDCIATVFGKSTYARLAINLNMTPIEPTWKGIITIEIGNTSGFPARVHSGMGIGQMVIDRADRDGFEDCWEESTWVDPATGRVWEYWNPLDMGYADKPGQVYQNQSGVTAARV